MKLSIFVSAIICSASIFIAGCNREELAQSQQQNDSLVAAILERDSAINGFIASFNDVETSLDSVTAKQRTIYLNTSKSDGELKPGQKERINAEIEAINNLMEENRKTIIKLSDRLKKSSSKNVQLEKTIARLNRQLFQKNIELTTLNDELNLANFQVERLKTSVDTLTTQNNEKTQVIFAKNVALHTAYYVIGKSKELQDAKLIDKKGGLLGIGKTPKLSSDFDKNKFIRIDYRVTTSITINSNIKIITSHPADSYVLNKDPGSDKVNTLSITNPENFWSASKYLVIVSN